MIALLSAKLNVIMEFVLTLVEKIVVSSSVLKNVMNYLIVGVNVWEYVVRYAPNFVKTLSIIITNRIYLKNHNKKTPFFTSLSAQTSIFLR